MWKIEVSVCQWTEPGSKRIWTQSQTYWLHSVVPHSLLSKKKNKKKNHTHARKVAPVAIRHDNWYHALFISLAVLLSHHSQVSGMLTSATGETHAANTHGKINNWANIQRTRQMLKSSTKDGAAGRRGLCVAFHCICTVNVPSGTTVCGRRCDLVLSHLFFGTHFFFFFFFIYLFIFCYLLFFSHSDNHFQLGSHLEPHLCSAINNWLLRKINCSRPGTSKGGWAQKQFDTGHERVQIAITRLTDLWQTLTRFRTEKDRSSTIVFFEPAEAFQHIKKLLPPSIHSYSYISNEQKEGLLSPNCTVLKESLFPPLLSVHGMLIFVRRKQPNTKTL